MGWMEVGAAEEFPLGSGREIVVGGQIVAVFHAEDGFWAVDGMCAHQGGPLAQGKLDGHCVTCPWHGWQYDVRSGKHLLTGRPMLTVYRVENRAGRLWIEVPETVEG
ncbi:MAG: hypothetical protein KatS3mg111_1586 [Pirellulaceae bacterium]|nr:MAG: hypothetical protein KatS3mg111_1586 [Pirellulaceae bacterium]